MSQKLAAFCLALAAVCCSSVSRADYFTAITNLSVGDNPQGAWLGNLRGDGNSRDMVVANYNANTISVRLFISNGLFGHEDIYAVGLNPAGVHTGDFNRDGLEDIVVANSGTNTVSVLLNLGGGANFGGTTNFTVGTIANPVPVAVTVRDVNGDSRLDLIVANSAEDSVSVLFGLAGGAFGGATNNYSVGDNPRSVTVANLNSNSFVDILTADKTAGTLTLLPGLTNGLFDSPITITLFPGGDPQPVSALAGDFNGDGRQDIAVANYASNSISILLQDGMGDFAITNSYDVGSGPTSLLVRDVNRDDILDITVANSGDDNVQVFIGDGNGGFASVGTFSVGDNPSVVVGSNFNEDRATDLCVANAGDDNVTILMFNGPLADNVAVTVNEDSMTNVVLRGRIFDGTTLTNILVTCPTNGTLNVDCPTNGLLTNLVYTPDPDFFGTDTFTYQVTDGTLTSLVATVTITVLPVNDQPSFDLSDTEITVLEDAATTNITGFATNIFQGADNETNQSVFFTCTTTNIGFFALKPLISSSGRLSFRPTKNVTGTATITVYMKDNGGTLRGGVNTTTTQAFDVVVSPHPLKPFKGTYSGLFYDTNGVQQPSSGFIKFTMQAYGAFSGRLIGDGGNYPIGGQFDLDGHAHTEVVRNNSTLQIDMDLDLVNGSNQVTGTVAEPTSWTAQFIGDRALFDAVTNPAPQAGKYTMTLPGNENDPALKPAGDGYATLTVTSSGKIRASGKLADGTSFSQTAYLSQSGQWPFYAPLYSSRGSVLSWITFTNEVDYSLEGAGSWIKPAIASTFYPNGFTNSLAISGSTYTSPPPGTTVLPFTNCVLYLAGGNLAGNITNADAILNYVDNKVYIGTRVVLTLSPSSGLMTGIFVDTDLGVTRMLRSVVLQQEGTARGYFKGTTQSGSVLLQEN